MECYASEFNADIGKWSTSSVMDMSWMFGDAQKSMLILVCGTRLELSTSIKMVERAQVFNTDIGGWDISKVTRNVLQLQRVSW
jgi:hypothetical protein